MRSLAHHHSLHNFVFEFICQFRCKCFIQNIFLCICSLLDKAQKIIHELNQRAIGIYVKQWWTKLWINKIQERSLIYIFIRSGYHLEICILIHFSCILMVLPIWYYFFFFVASHSDDVASTKKILSTYGISTCGNTSKNNEFSIRNVENEEFLWYYFLFTGTFNVN